MDIIQDTTLSRSDLYYKEVGRISTLTVEKEKELRDSVVSGKVNAAKGREMLVNGSLRLVVMIAKRYAGKGMPLNDLIQSGNIGLIEAANAFDWSKDCTFSSFATHYIKKEIILCLRQANIVSLPDKEYQLAKKFERYTNENDIPTDDEAMLRCASILNISVRKLKKLIDGEITSPINCSLSDDENRDIDVADTSYNEDALCDICDSSSLIVQTSTELPRREKDILFLYYGIGCQRMNYEEIGKKYRKNKQWAHREVQKAIATLRSSSDIQAFGNRMAV